LAWLGLAWLGLAWLAANKLSLNVKKTHFVIFKAKNKKMPTNINIKIGDQSIEQVNNTNFLGLILTKIYLGNTTLRK